MHRFNAKRLLITAAVLAVTAVTLSLVILLTGADLTAVMLFALLVMAGAAIVWLVSLAFEESPKVDLARVVKEPIAPPVARRDPPPEPVATIPASLSPRAPVPARISLEPSEAMSAFLEALPTDIEALAAHLWLEDPPTATVRLVASSGSQSIESIPRPSGEGVFARALASDHPVVERVAELTTHDSSKLVWRVATALASDEARGVFALDVTGPDGASAEMALPHLEAYASVAGAVLSVYVSRQASDTAKALTEASRALSRSLDIEAVMQEGLRYAMEASCAETGSIMLFDAVAGGLMVRVSEGIPDEAKDRITRPSEGIAGWVFTSAQPLLVEDLPPQRNAGKRGNVRSAVSVPIADETGVIGVLNVGSREYPARFTRAHMEAIEVIGRQISVAFRNAEAMAASRELYLNTLRTLAIAMETKDPYSRGSTARIEELVYRLGEKLGLAVDDLDALRVAALFHDLGMDAAGSGVTNENRPLTTVERGLLKMHPVVAAEVLAEVPSFAKATAIVYHHHEHFDGEGYVGGLAGERIPMGARILSVVDAFVAMTTERPYRGPMLEDAALNELETHAGTQFDPKVVAAFAEMVRGERSRSRKA